MSKANLLSVFFLFLVLPFAVFAQEESPQDLFLKGTQFYIAKDYAQAQESFQKSLEKDPRNSTTMTNLAMAQFQLGHKSIAVGLLRKALAAEPDLLTAQQAYKFILSQMEIKEVPHQLESYETLRRYFLQPIPLTAYLAITALLFFAAGWALLAFVDRRKKAMIAESALPPFPVLATLYSVIFVLFTGLLVLKIHDSRQIRGTVIDERIALQTAPGENQASVLDLYGGMEVLLLSEDGEWAQVSYPGSLSGWIKKSSLIMTR
ncbi:Tetratricopeptide repeat protein [compost metagenome]